MPQRNQCENALYVVRIGPMGPAMGLGKHLYSEDSFRGDFPEFYAQMDGLHAKIKSIEAEANERPLLRHASPIHQLADRERAHQPGQFPTR